MRFQGTKSYIATEDLKLAVDASLSLEKPLLVKGEPGTGKTMLALEVAESLGMPLLEGVGLSTQIGDMGSFFITVGAMTLIGAVTTTRHWFYAPSMLLLVAALYRTLSTILYGAPFVMSAIVVEISIGLFLIFAGSRISTKD